MLLYQLELMDAAMGHDCSYALNLIGGIQTIAFTLIQGLFCSFPFIEFPMGKTADKITIINCSGVDQKN